MKVAVTGANGFIGRHVLATLKDRSVEVIAVVRDSSEHDLSLHASQIVQIDLEHVPADAYDLMGRPDVLIHLAWSGLPNYRSLTHFEAELPRQYQFLRGMIEAGLPALLVAGTCFEYGMQSGALSEDLIPLPANPYGFAKNTLRCQLEYLKTEFPYQLIWARLFYLFGEGQSENSLWPQLKQTVERGDTLFPMSGGEQLRDYLPVPDVAGLLATLALMKKDIGIVNVCSGHPVSVRKLVEGWIDVNSWDVTPQLGQYPYPDYEPMAFWGERKKIDSLLESK